MPKNDLVKPSERMGRPRCFRETKNQNGGQQKDEHREAMPPCLVINKLAAGQGIFESVMEK